MISNEIASSWGNGYLLTFSIFLLMTCSKATTSFTCAIFVKVRLIIDDFDSLLLMIPLPCSQGEEAGKRERERGNLSVMSHHVHLLCFPVCLKQR